VVAWTIEAARASRRIDRLVVSSDDPEVLAIAAGYDERLPLERPAELSTDESLAIEFVRHALAALEAGGEGPFDAVAILQPSSPLALPEDIDATIELLETSGADSAVSVTKLDFMMHPMKMKTLDGDRLLPFLEEEGGRMAARELPTIYVRNGCVYVSRRASIEQGQVIGADCRGHVMPRERSIDINDEADFLYAHFLVSQANRSGTVQESNL
jgi:CMP-N,N'-diacetyllegionaminic acid synthase